MCNQCQALTHASGQFIGTSIDIQKLVRVEEGQAESRQWRKVALSVRSALLIASLFTEEGV